MFKPDRQDLRFGSTKTYTASVGLSTAFRQWRADSHCNQLHGYALSFRAEFEAAELNSTNWVVDFGSLKSFKRWLESMFDHTTLVAADDPHLPRFKLLHAEGVMNVRVLPHVGCEYVAYHTFERLEQWLLENNQSPRVQLMKLEVSEHEGNSAYVRRA